VTTNAPTIELGAVSLDLSARTHIMGVLNLTPDSFSDGGRLMEAGGRPDPVRVADEALRMVEEGADIIDVGGESTRPGSMRVSASEEIARVVPAIREITSRTSTPVSIDTCKSETARAALDAGASIINDISGMGFDPAMAALAAGSGAAVVLMHMKGTPADMQKDPTYGDLVGEVRSFLMDAAGRAAAAGVPKGRIMLDVGIGFGKTLEHNLELINRLGEFVSLGYPIVLGVSRKAFIGALTGGPPPDDRLEGTIAANVVGIARGASIIRVHDVRVAKRAALVADAVLRA
jgi:dihydropteroate synthase